MVFWSVADKSPKVEFWDLIEKKKMTELEMGEPIIAIRVTPKYFIIVLTHRTVSLEYTKDPETNAIGLGKVKGLYHTADNQYGLCCVRGEILALPGETPGQVQVLTLSSKEKKVFKAHETALRQMTLSKDGTILATASQTVSITYNIFQKHTNPEPRAQLSAYLAPLIRPSLRNYVEVSSPRRSGASPFHLPATS